MELNLIVMYLYNTTIIILCSSSSYFPTLDLVQRVDFLSKITGILTTTIYFSLNLTMHTKADLQIAHCAHRVCALQSSSYYKECLQLNLLMITI